MKNKLEKILNQLDKFEVERLLMRSDKIDDYLKLELLEKYEFFMPAIKLAEKLEKHDKISYLYEKELERLDKSGNPHNAATLAIELKLYDKALKYYEKCRFFDSAAELAEQLNIPDKAKELHKKEIKKLEYDWEYDLPDYSRAGDYALKHKIYDEAEKYYRMDSNYYGLLELYKEIGDEKELIRSFNDFIYYSKHCLSFKLDVAKKFGFEKEYIELATTNFKKAEKENDYYSMAYFSKKLGDDENAKKYFDTLIDELVTTKSEYLEKGTKRINLLGLENLALTLDIPKEIVKEKLKPFYQNNINYFTKKGEYLFASFVAKEAGLIKEQIDCLIKNEQYDDALKLTKEYNLKEKELDIYHQRKNYKKALELSKELKQDDKVEFYQTILDNF
jgi:hypothetical protein